MNTNWGLLTLNPCCQNGFLVPLVSSAVLQLKKISIGALTANDI